MLRDQCGALRAERFTITITLDDDWARIEISDAADALPITPDPDSDAPSGRGVMIADHPQGVTHDQVRQLREAQRSNPELVGAWHVDYHLGRLEQHLGPPPAEAVTPRYNDYYDREPF